MSAHLRVPHFNHNEGLRCLNRILIHATEGVNYVTRIEKHPIDSAIYLFLSSLWVAGR